VASKIIQGDIPPGGTITGKVFDRNTGALISTSGDLSFSQTGANPLFNQATMTDAAIGTQVIVLYRNGSAFADYLIDFPQTETAGSYDFQDSPTVADIAAGIVDLDIKIVVAIPPAVATGSLTPGQITCTRGDTLAVTNGTTVALLGNISARTKLSFTAKLPWAVQNSANTDSQAIIQVVEGIGLTILNGAPASNSAYGSLVVTDASTGVFTLTIAAQATAAIPIEDLLWDVQVEFASNISTPINGTFSIAPDVTQATN
jgi:hypothetical protein